MTHIKRIDEMFAVDGEIVLKSIESSIMKERSESISRMPDESFEEFEMRMKQI